MSLKEIKQNIREMSKKVNDIIEKADEQTKDIFKKEYETLVRLGGGKNITIGSKLRKQEAIKYASELNRAIKLEEFTEKGSIEKEARIEKAWESFQRNHPNEKWTKEEWKEIGELFDNLGEKLKGHLSSDDMVEQYRKAVKRSGMSGKT